MSINKTNNIYAIENLALKKSLKDYSMINDINREKKIAEIKSRIEAGTYNIDPRLTAMSMLNHMKGSNI